MTRVPHDEGETYNERYRCQATDLFRATTPSRWWDRRQYVKDLTSRNVRLQDFTRYVMIAGFNVVMRMPSRLNKRAMEVLAYVTNQESNSCSLQVRDRLPAPWKVRDHVKACVARYALLRGFVRYLTITILKLIGPLNSRLRLYPHVSGLATKKTPTEVLNLQPGDLVRVRSLDEIRRTINRERKNRGLKFDREMVRYCGGVYQVLARVEKIIDEKTGKLIHLSNDCLILDGVICTGCVSQNRLFCPRSLYPYWREIWLQRVDNGKPRERTETRSENISSSK
jgi:hypothetical protein